MEESWASKNANKPFRRLTRQQIPGNNPQPINPYKAKGALFTGLKVHPTRLQINLNNMRYFCLYFIKNTQNKIEFSQNKSIARRNKQKFKITHFFPQKMSKVHKIQAFYTQTLYKRRSFHFKQAKLPQKKNIATIFQYWVSASSTICYIFRHKFQLFVTYLILWKPPWIGHFGKMWCLNKYWLKYNGK